MSLGDWLIVLDYSLFGKFWVILLLVNGFQEQMNENSYMGIKWMKTSWTFLVCNAFFFFLFVFISSPNTLIQSSLTVRLNFLKSYLKKSLNFKAFKLMVVMIRFGWFLFFFSKNLMHNETFYIILFLNDTLACILAGPKRVL